MKCCVPACRTNVCKAKDTTHHRFNFNKLLNLKEAKNKKICSLHFKTTDFTKSGGRKVLLKTAVPCFEIPKLPPYEFVNSQNSDTINQNHSMNEENEEEVEIYSETVSTEENVDEITEESNILNNITSATTHNFATISNNLLNLGDREETDYKKLNGTLLLKLNKTISQLEKISAENKSLKRKLKTIEERNNRKKQRLNNSNPNSKLFNEDQMHVLSTGSINGMNWSTETIKKSLQTKFACGNRGYQYLLNEGFPLPSSRTLSRKTLGLEFDTEINEQTFEFLRKKAKNFNYQEKQCMIVCDEMSISPGTQYDGTDSIVGHNIIPLSRSTATVNATKALIILVCGTSTRWKFVVGYHFTGDSINAECFKSIIFEIIKKVEGCGLFVNSFTSDMGSANKALWKLLNISARRNKSIVNFILHPCNQSRKLWIFADVPHLFKNITQAFLSHENIHFDKCIIDKYNLPIGNADIKHVFQLHNVQQDMDLKLAPRLQSHNLRPSGFEKMKIAISSNLIHPHVSTSLNYLDDETQNTDLKATAWFMEVLTKWFNIMSSRSSETALSTKNIPKYKETTCFLKEFMHIVQHLTIDKRWKSFQHGILISTKSALEITEYLKLTCGSPLYKSYTQLTIKRLSLLPHITWPTEDCYTYFHEMEINFRCIYPIIKNKQHVSKILQNWYENNLTQIEFPSVCHNIKKEITKRFIQFKLKTIGGIRTRRIGTDYSSRSMN